MNFYRQRWVSWLWRKDPWAVTIGSCTFYSVPRNRVSIRWLRHEDEHKRQWRREWYLLFAVKYIYYNITLGYWNNPYEIAAREAEHGKADSVL